MNRFCPFNVFYHDSPFCVVAAKAGTQCAINSAEIAWMPASAGMTMVAFRFISASQSYLIAPSFGYSVQPLIFRLQFFSLNQFLIRLGDQILRADFFDRRDLVV